MRMVWASATFSFLRVVSGRFRNHTVNDSLQTKTAMQLQMFKASGTLQAYAPSVLQVSMEFHLPWQSQVWLGSRHQRSPNCSAYSVLGFLHLKSLQFASSRKFRHLCAFLTFHLIPGPRLDTTLSRISFIMRSLYTTRRTTF